MPSLTSLTDRPELTVEVGGRVYSFSELPIGKLADLQVWIRQHSTHPIDALKGHLDGLLEGDRATLLEAARQEARRWPPEIGTAEGAAALLGSEAGQREAFYAGLSVHHPEVTRDEAVRIFRSLQKDAAREAKRAKREGREYDGEGAARRIFAVLFGMDDDDEDDAPKAYPGPMPGRDGASIGRISSGLVNSG